MCFELLGENLLSVLRRRGALPARDVKRVTRELLRGLAFIHQDGVNILHADIKPENVVVISRGDHDHSHRTTPGGSDAAAAAACEPAPGSADDEGDGGLGDVKIVDFGTAVDVGRQHVRDIQTRAYRCPEAIVGAWPYAGAADVWSLGCLVFEARGVRMATSSEGRHIVHHFGTHSANGRARTSGARLFSRFVAPPTAADGRNAVRPAVASARRVVHDGRESPRAGSVIMTHSSVLFSVLLLRANNPRPSPLVVAERRRSHRGTQRNAVSPHTHKTHVCRRLCALSLHAHDKSPHPPPPPWPAARKEDERLDEMPSLRFATQTELVVAVGSSGGGACWMRQVIELLGALPPLLVQRGRRATQGGWFEDRSASALAAGAPQLRRIRLADSHGGSLGVRSLVATVVLLFVVVTVVLPGRCHRTTS